MFEAALEIISKAPAGPFKELLQRFLQNNLGVEYLQLEKYIEQSLLESERSLLETLIKTLSGTVPAYYLLTCMNETPVLDRAVAHMMANTTTAEAQFWLGRSFKLNKQAETAVSWFDQAARQGHLGAQFELGLCYAKGEGTPKDEYKAFTLLESVAQAGVAEAQFRVGLYYGEGIKQLKRISSKLFFIEKVGSLPVDLNKAVEWFRKAADQNHLQAQVALSECYRQGLGVPLDLDKALNLFLQAAHQGDAEIQNNLGSHYFYGRYATPNLTQAVEWFKKAAEQNHARAQCNLGSCYAEGKGVKKDIHQAFVLFKQAAKNGEAEAQNNLGFYYFEGKSGVRDVAKAKKWFKKAAQQGNSRGQRNLGTLYYHEKKVDNALQWLKKAAAQRCVEALDDLRQHYERVDNSVAAQACRLLVFSLRNGETISDKRFEQAFRQESDDILVLADARLDLPFCYHVARMQTDTTLLQTLFTQYPWVVKALFLKYEIDELKADKTVCDWLSTTDQDNRLNTIKQNLRNEVIAKLQLSPEKNRAVIEQLKQVDEKAADKETSSSKIVIGGPAYQRKEGKQGTDTKQQETKGVFKQRKP